MGGRTAVTPRVGTHLEEDVTPEFLSPTFLRASISLKKFAAVGSNDAGAAA
jgi:hypothetical protein